MPKQFYSFPILDQSEMLACFGELHMNVRDEDLLKPSAQAVHAIYTQFLEITMNITREDMIQPQFSENLEYQELHEESIPMITFLRACHKLMRTVGIADFCMNDVMKPDPKRLRRNVSAIINFLKFREDRLDRYQELAAKAEGFLTEKQHLEAANEKLLAEIRAINAQRQAEEPEVQAREAENAELSAQIGELNKQQAAMNQDAHQLKQKWQEVGDQISEAKYKLLNAKQEQESLRSQIVPSPEKLKKTLVDLGESIEHEKENIAECHRRARGFAAKHDALAEADKDVARALRLLDEVELEDSRVKKLDKDIEDCKAALQANDEALHEATFKEHQLNRQINSIQERTSRMHKQHASKQESAVEALDAAQREWNEVDAERKAAEEQIEQDELVIRAEREKLQRLKQQHEAEVTHIQHKHERLDAQVSAYHKKLLEVMQAR